MSLRISISMVCRYAQARFCLISGSIPAASTKLCRRNFLILRKLRFCFPCEPPPVARMLHAFSSV